MRPLTYRDHKILVQNLPMTGPSAGSAGSASRSRRPKRAPRGRHHPSSVRPRWRLLRPRPQTSATGARRCCQGWPQFCGHPGPWPGLGLHSIEHDGMLVRSGEPLSSMRHPSVSTWRRQFEFPVPVPACSTESRELPSGTPSNSAISSPSNYVLLLTASAQQGQGSCRSLARA
jgi:hypothetical protein